MSDLPFLDTEEPVVETPVAEPEAQAPVEAQPEPEGDRPRDEHGRFAPKDKPEPVMVPIQALHETRDKVRDLEARIAGLQPPPQVPELPDVFEDQEGYTKAIEQTIEQRLYQQQLQMSERFARIQHGEELTNAALEWGVAKCNSDPFFNAQAKASGDPVGFAVAHYQREQIATQVTPDDYQQFQAWKAAQAQAQAAPAAQPASTPPQSIASLPSSGGAAHVPVGPGQAFDSLFVR